MSYEVLVERHVSPATLATFPVAMTTTRVPRNRVRRLRVRADQDLAEVVRRLTERQVQLLEIRRCPAAEQPRTTPAPARAVDVDDPGTAELIALPIPASAPRPPESQPPGRRSLATVRALAPVLPGRPRRPREATER